MLLFDVLTRFKAKSSTYQLKRSQGIFGFTDQSLGKLCLKVDGHTGQCNQVQINVHEGPINELSMDDNWTEPGSSACDDKLYKCHRDEVSLTVAAISTEANTLDNSTLRKESLAEV